MEALEAVVRAEVERAVVARAAVVRVAVAMAQENQ